MIACDRCGTAEGKVRRFVVGVLCEADPGFEPTYSLVKGHRPLRMDLCQGCLQAVGEAVGTAAISLKHAHVSAWKEASHGENGR